MASDFDSSRANLLGRARSSYTERAWTAACTAFGTADKAAPIEPSDLVLYATTAYMLGKVSEMLEIQERAYHAYREQGEVLHAARTALWLATNLASRGKIPQASGWVELSERLLLAAPEDCVERGYLLMPRMLRHVACRRVRRCRVGRCPGSRHRETLRRSGPHGPRSPNPGPGTPQTLENDEGLRLLDEVMISVTGSRLSPMVTGHRVLQRPRGLLRNACDQTRCGMDALA